MNTPIHARASRRVRAGALLIAVTCGLLLAACGGGQEPTSPPTTAAPGPVPAVGASPGPVPPLPDGQKLAELERSGVLPRLDRSDSLAGPDLDRNGVRDDIDAYIQRTYVEAGQRAAALQLARGLQASVVLNSPDREPNRAVGRQISRATNCVFTHFNSPSARNPSVVGRELEGMTANTKARLKAYLQHNKALDGTAWALPTQDTCE